MEKFGEYVVLASTDTGTIRKVAFGIDRMDKNGVIILCKSDFFKNPVVVEMACSFRYWDEFTEFCNEFLYRHGLELVDVVWSWTACPVFIKEEKIC